MDTNKNQLIANAIMNLEPIPSVDKRLDLRQYAKISFGSLSALGAMFTPFTKNVQEVVMSGGGNLYRAVDDFGNEVTNLFAKHNGKGYISSYHNAQGDLAQANMIKVDDISSKVTSLTYNPSALFMGAALISMQKEMSEIKENQQQILDFLRDDKRASLRGDILYMGAVIADYQYNLDSDAYKSTAYIKVQDILQSSEQNVAFYTDRINRLISEDSVFIVDKSIKSTLGKILTEFAEYKTALYLYGISTFLSVLLIENFNEEYLESIIDRLENASYQYRELYTKCYNIIESQTKKSLDTRAAGLIADASKNLGNFIANLPLISRSQIGETLIKTHNKINSIKSTQNSQLTERLLANRDNGIQVFINNLKNINRLYNCPTEILFDTEGMYIKTID